MPLNPVLYVYGRGRPPQAGDMRKRYAGDPVITAAGLFHDIGWFPGNRRAGMFGIRMS